MRWRTLWHGVCLLALAVVAVPAALVAHEVMHGFGGAFFGYGVKLNPNGADPIGIPDGDLRAWLSVALSGTVYLFLASGIALLAFYRWRQPWLLAVVFATGMVHQAGFWDDAFSLPAITGLSDPFHAAAILWNGGSLSGMTVDWPAAISGWGLLIVAVSLLLSLVVSICLVWGIVDRVQIWNQLGRRRPKGSEFFWFFGLVLFLVLWLVAAFVSTKYAEWAHSLPGWSGWTLPAPTLLIAGALLTAVPVLAFALAWWRVPTPVRR
jgi:hypothetical protein